MSHWFYVAKGEILYQVEGEKPRLLREGDAFYEPVGRPILRFDNASATEEAIFIDINLQQQGEPFIVFEQPLTENIDRRTLPTTTIGNPILTTVDTYVSELEPLGRKSIAAATYLIAYVAEGIVHVKIDGKKTRRVVAGSTFSLEAGQQQATIVNTSRDVPAKVVSFQLN